MPTKSKTRRLQVEGLEPRVVLSSYFVATTGSDTAAGTQAAPWKTLQRAADIVRPGDTVQVRAGNYAGFNLSNSGTAAAPIQFVADSGVVINTRNPKTQDGINLESASYVTIKGFEVVGMPRAGIRSVTNNHVSIVNNVTDQNGYWGIFTAFSDQLEIVGNTTSRSVQQHGIYVSNSSVAPVVRGNDVWGNRGNGIHFNGDISQGGTGVVKGALIENNIIHDNGVGGGSAINADGLQSSTIRNNLLYNNHASGISLYRIDASAGSTNNVVVNNTIVQASDARYALNIQNGSTGNFVSNNILYNANSSAGSITISTDSLTNFKSDYNIVVDKFTSGSSIRSLSQWRSATGQDAHSFASTPSALFANAAGNNYHLAKSSPAIDKGTTSNAPGTDLEGQGRPSGAANDIGSYEMQTATSTAPAPAPAAAPSVSRTTPSSGATGVSTSTVVTATFNQSVNPTSISFVVKNSSGQAVAGTVAYNSTTFTATFRPTSALATSTTYTATVSGATNDSAIAMANPVSWSFSTAAPAATNTTVGVFAAGFTPKVTTNPDSDSVELGMKFKSSVAGTVTGVRFYKGTGNTGTHIGNLWSSTGKLLATATFTNETDSGWQTVNFSNPVAITPGTTYVVSYFAPKGHYAADQGFFTSAYSNGPLSVPANGGVYAYGSTRRFPSSSYKATNYAVDVMFKPSS